MVELVARDAHQPGERRRAGVAVAPPSGEGRGERLRGEVGSLLRVPRPARSGISRVMERTDAELLAGSARDPEAFGIFYDRYAERLLAYFADADRYACLRHARLSAARRRARSSVERHRRTSEPPTSLIARAGARLRGVRAP